jgi:hypothetical protein
MKNLAKAEAGTVAVEPEPLTFWARQLMMGVMNSLRSRPPVVVSTPLALLLMAQ